MQINPRRMKVIAFVLALAFELFFGAFTLFDAFLTSRFGIGSELIDSDGQSVLKGILIFVSAYGLVTVLALQYWRTELLNRFSARPTRLSPETIFLLLNYPPLASPAFYGYLLYRVGSPLNEALYFIGAAIVMTLILGSYDFRKA